jgi:hypothetical protein
VNVKVAFGSHPVRQHGDAQRESNVLKLYNAVYDDEKVYIVDELWRIAHQGSVDDMLEALMVTIPVAGAYAEPRRLMAAKLISLLGAERARSVLRGLQVEVDFDV